MPFPNPATQFKPGNPGGGRPKGTGVTDRLRKLLDDADKDGKTGSDFLADVAYQAARTGDFRFWEAIVNRVEGPVAAKVEVEVRVVHEIVEAFAIVLRSELDEPTADRILTRTIELAEGKRLEDARLLGGAGAGGGSVAVSGGQALPVQE